MKKSPIKLFPTKPREKDEAVLKYMIYLLKGISTVSNSILCKNVPKRVTPWPMF
jgi:hypothetical protein